MVIVDSSTIFMVLLTGSNEDSPCKRLHLVADRSHCHRVVSSRLQLRMDVIMFVIRWTIMIMSKMKIKVH